MINTSDIKNNTISLVISATCKEIIKKKVEKKSRLRIFYEIIYADCGCHEYPDPYEVLIRLKSISGRA